MLRTLQVMAKRLNSVKNDSRPGPAVSAPPSDGGRLVASGARWGTPETSPVIKSSFFTKSPRAIVDLNVKKDFPIFKAHPELVYLDTAATAHKPQAVIDAEREFYEKNYATTHRGMYALAAEATAQYEAVRQKAADFINAGSAGEIVFTSNATTALNLAAHIEAQRLQPGDEIILTTAEHHSNILPWQRVAAQTGAKIVWLELDDSYAFPLNELRRKVSMKTRVVSIAHISNVLGYVAPLTDIVAVAHDVGARVVVDAAQSGGRMPIDVRALGIDYAAFSGHKMYGPTGTGWLYAKGELLGDAEPLVVGGGTIKSVTRENTEWHDVPWRFEGGTPNVAGVIALGAAIEYLAYVGMERIWQHEQALAAYALEKLSALEGLMLYGPVSAEQRGGVFSFTLEVGGAQLHSHDVTSLADQLYKVALRGGHHCAQPLMRALGVNELTRASVGIYTTKEDIDTLIQALEAVQEVFSKNHEKMPTRGTS